MKLNDKISALRKQRGMLQEELAEQLRVSRQSVSRWETGSAQPDGGPPAEGAALRKRGR